MIQCHIEACLVSLVYIGVLLLIVGAPQEFNSSQFYER